MSLTRDQITITTLNKRQGLGVFNDSKGGQCDVLVKCNAVDEYESDRPAVYLPIATHR